MLLAHSFHIIINSIEWFYYDHVRTPLYSNCCKCISNKYIHHRMERWRNVLTPLFVKYCWIHWSVYKFQFQKICFADCNSCPFDLKSPNVIWRKWLVGLVKLSTYCSLNATAKVILKMFFNIKSSNFVIQMFSFCILFDVNLNCIDQYRYSQLAI